MIIINPITVEITLDLFKGLSQVGWFFVSSPTTVEITLDLFKGLSRD